MPVRTAEAIWTGTLREGQGTMKFSNYEGAYTRASRFESGEGTNPEQLFAAGYAACFHSALQMVARAEKANVADSAVGARVGIGPNGAGGFGLAVTLEVSLPHLPHDQAVELTEKAHQVCPYSNATRGNIEVTLEVSKDDE